MILTVPASFVFKLNYGQFSVLKKATGRGEKEKRGGVDVDGGETEGALLMAGCLLALLEVEETIMVKTIPDTTRRAQVHSKRLWRTLNQSLLCVL